VRRISRLAVLGVLAALALAGIAASASAAPVISVAELRIQEGDDPRWAAPAYDDRTWPRVALRDVTAPGGPRWLRATVELPPGAFPAGQPIGVLFAGMASHELYWDGVRIGAGGVVGDGPDTEVAGPIAMRHWLPGEHDAPGRHVLALRLSAHHRTIPVSRPMWLLLVGSYDELGATKPLYVWIAIASVSGLVLGAMFALVMFFYHRTDRAFLHLCAMCVTGVALLAAESWRPLFGYSYDWHGPRLLLVASLTWVLSALVVAFTVARLPRAGGRWFVAIAAVAMACAWIVPGWDVKAWLMFLIGLGCAFGWTARALRERERGSRPMAIALAVSLLVLVAAPERFADVGVFLMLDFLLLCLIVPYAIERGRERGHRDRALVTAARLETELVRRHLQPHFLMNTLTALGEWIEEDPRVAAEMIGALAEELRLLHDILDRSLITMDEELRLCRAHLAVMSRRKGRTYRLVARDVDPRAAIPPAIFHTLVENAVTHGAKLPATVELVLAATTHDDRVRYVLEAPLGSVPPPPRPEGTGSRYIRARLAESFGARWTFHAGPSGDMWRTELELPARPA
jgi:hypothetical protein